MQDQTPATARQCVEAIRLGEGALTRGGHDPGRLTVMRAEYRPGTTKEADGAMVWRLTFKPRELLPASPHDPIGAGGEVFVEVDVTTGRAQVTGLGE